MAEMFCPDGDHKVKVAFQPLAGERFCPAHRCPLRPIPKLSKSSTRRGMTPDLERLEAAAREAFGREVKRHRCFLADSVEGVPNRADHVCSGTRLDPHHLVEVQWMRRELALPPEELIAVMFNPVIGAPLCRGGHNAVELRVSEFIYWDELRLEAIEFCEAVDRRTPAGTPSMLERLKIECPVREAVQ